MSDNKRSPRRKVANTADMENFLNGLGLAVKPTLHINGPSHYQAIVTVDFGEPKEPFRLSNDQMHELVSNIRSLTRDILGHAATVSINTDNSRGIFWASVA